MMTFRFGVFETGTKKIFSLYMPIQTICNQKTATESKFGRYLFQNASNTVAEI